MRELEALDRGMRAQLRRYRELLAAGMPRLGWKIGINDPRVQRKLGLEGPVVGFLRGDRVLASGAAYAPRPDAIVMVEAEVAIHLARDLLPGCPREAAWSAVAGVAPAIEIVDYAQPTDGLAAILAHSMFHDAVVLSVEQPPSAAAALAVDHPVLQRSRALARTPDPTFAPRDLTGVLLHAAGFLARYGESLRAGDWLISGAFVQPLAVCGGDSIDAVFGATFGDVHLEIVVQT